MYGTFVPGFRSAMAELPQNTIGVYSYSKHFGCTGWRLGVVAVHQNNIFDRMIAKLPAKVRARLNHRYSPITLEPEKVKFIDRMVADSRMVALNHTAGLSLPSANPDDAVFVLRAARQGGQLQEPLPAHLSPPVACAV